MTTKTPRWARLVAFAVVVGAAYWLGKRSVPPVVDLWGMCR